jgi:emp24/gp25L/p24 family/GOLD
VYFSIHFTNIISGNFDCYEEGNSFVRNCRSIEVWIEAIPSRHEEQQQRHHYQHHQHDTMNPYLWESQEGSSEEIFHIPIHQNPEGDIKSKYQICFESSSKQDDEVVENEEDDNIPNAIRIGFHLRIEHIVNVRTLPDNELGPDAQRALHVIDTADTSVESWHHLLDHFDYMHNREAIHDRLLQQTSNRVIGWSIVEAILVIAMAIAQVCYWKSFFEQRRYL